MSFLRKLFGKKKRVVTPTDSRHKEVQDREEAQSWAQRLAEAHDWLSLAAIFSATTDPNFYKRMEYARTALLGAGAEAVDAIVEQLNRVRILGAGDLAKILVTIGDRRAIEPLLRCFDDVGAHGGLQGDIVEFFARLGAVEAAQGLVPYLDRSYGTRFSAAYGLGLLGVPETAAALQAALEKNSWTIQRGLERARTEFARSLIAEWTARRRAAGPDVERLSEQEMLQILGQYADASIANDQPVIEKLGLLVRDIGEELDRRGGIAEMRRVAGKLEARLQRGVEWAWDGIGEWDA